MVMGGHKLALARGEQTVLLLALWSCFCVGDGVFVLLMAIVP
jgi:hypothetical protein